MTFDQLVTRWRDMEPHVATLRRLGGDAQTIVEFGVRGGVSTWALLDGLRLGGRLVSVDIADVYSDLPTRITADQRWRFVHGDDRDPELWQDLPQAELVVIDTSHEYHHTLTELEIARVLGARRIALHDWALADVADAAMGFISRTDYRLWLLEPSEWGLAVLAR